MFSLLLASENEIRLDGFKRACQRPDGMWGVSGRFASQQLNTGSSTHIIGAIAKIKLTAMFREVKCSLAKTISIFGVPLGHLTLKMVLIKKKKKKYKL